ncbi:MAG: thymidine phosphorylase [Bacteroidota bacterium]|jgi:pyrimidine-nucleoside phosphorylase
MNPTEIILKKRGGGKLLREELQFLVKGYLNGEIPDYQMSSFLMAVYFQKMDFEETTTLTDIMLHSGSVVNLSRIAGVKVDKHSTGGVGDKVSLILAPIVAACGVPVPMISGRGLGHTGGTLDKLESIPGFRTSLSLSEFEAVVAEVGVAMIGQTGEIAPADKKMYALRDVTGTVECIPLIASSIMSKKLAEGIEALVLDVKTGRGAFMRTQSDAMELAKILIAVSEKFGKKTVGFLTDMSQPLGYAIGNWNEVVECIDCMKGKDVPDLMELTYVLGGTMVNLGGKAKSVEEGMGLCREAIHSGQAFRKFVEMVGRQGGDITFVDHPEKYPGSKIAVEVRSSSAGYVGSIDALECGFSSLMLGAGRTKVDDAIDPKAGILLRKKVGDHVENNEVLALLTTDRKDIVESVRQRVKQSFVIGAQRTAPPQLVVAMLDKSGVHPRPAQ